jgi:DNA-binding NarL/FixJ family response regulator
MCSTRVLLVGLTTGVGDALEAALSRAHLEVFRARTTPDLWVRLARVGLEPPVMVFVDLTLPETLEDEFFGVLRRLLPSASLVALWSTVDAERAARLLGLGVPSLPLPGSLDALVELAIKLSSRPSPSVPRGARSRASAEPGGGGELANVLDAYAVARSLSSQQRAILKLYIAGNNDKAIAALCGCSVATVYEHWRRMARKAGAAHKADVVADFHRFLTGDTLSGFHGQPSEFARLVGDAER